MRRADIFKVLERFLHSKPAGLIAVALIAVGVVGGVFGGKAASWWADLSQREAEELYLGEKSPPTAPSLVDPAGKMLTPKPKYRLIRLRRIPPIEQGTPTPHPFVGDCKNCHLYLDGPSAGSQPITPFGSALAKISEVTKLGPPLRPDSHRPHPGAGRCIKCHDIVIRVPAQSNNDRYRWSL